MRRDKGRGVSKKIASASFIWSLLNLLIPEEFFNIRLGKGQK